jgi:hypothetical protein
MNLLQTVVNLYFFLVRRKVVINFFPINYFLLEYIILEFLIRIFSSLLV